MSRRDMIIVAVLINAGLLVMLFISSLKHDDPSLISAVASQSQKVEVVQPKKEIQLTKTPVDQVDKILSDFGSSSASQKTVVVDPKDKAFPLSQTHSNSSLKDEIKQPFLRHEESFITKLEESSDFLKVVVKKGDVLEKIAKQYGTTTEKIMQMNDLKGTNLKIGQVLNLPKETTKNEPQKQQVLKPQNLQADEVYYVVKHGDNLWKIAIENHVKIDDLLKLNQLNEKKAKALKPGDRLRIR